MSDAELLLDPVLQEMELDVGGVKVVAMGGGHGLAVALRAIQEYAGQISAVVSVADDGGSSGRLSPALDIPAMGDIRRALLALTPQPSVWQQLIEFRFEQSDVAGHSLGNLVIAALTELSGSFEDALNTVGRMLGARGAVIPTAAVPLTLEARIGEKTVTGQVAIATTRGPVGALRVLPEDAAATRSATDAISSADQIVLGPGSLFTSVIASLKVPGIAEAINSAAGRLVYVCNLITQDAETLGMSGDDHLAALGDVGGIRAPDVVVVHEGKLDVPPGVARVEISGSRAERIAKGNLADPSADWPSHDPARLGAVLRGLA